MMSKQKQNIKWKGREVQCYYESKLLREDVKFYESFIKQDYDYKIGDYIFVKRNIAQKRGDKICLIKCLFEEKGKARALVIPYEYAGDYRKSFLEIYENYEGKNEVVMEQEQIINLEDVTGKCRVIIGVKSDTVSEIIDRRGLNREFYFLCRYRNLGNGNLVLLMNENINETEITKIDHNFSNKTPSPKVWGSNKKPCIKKNCLDAMEIEDYNSPQIAQVKRNLNNSFNDSQSQDDSSLMNYSIVEQSNNDYLKIKLRVSNGRVLSNIPNSQPVVLLDNINTKKNCNKIDATYELKSPIFKKVIQSEKTSNNSQRKASRRISCDLPQTPKKLRDLNNMIENMEIKSPTESSPRKLRRLSRPIYCDDYNFSHRNSTETGVSRRTSGRMKNKVNYCETISKEEIETKKPRVTKIVPIIELSDSETELVEKMDIDDENSELVETRKLVRKRRNTSESRSIMDSNSNRNERSSKQTPKLEISTPKTDRLLKNNIPLKLIREGTLTPSIDQRRKSVIKNNTPLILARNNLHVSYVPTMLPCREKEYEEVYNFIEGKLEDRCGGCMYISGVPGTGKTATVTVAIENLMRSWKKNGNPEFNYVNVNGMRLTEPRQCYVEILKQLTGKRVPWEQALSTLEEKFTTKNYKKIVPTVLIIDELDILCTKRQDVVYNLLDWPTKTNAQLIVITIANTMDLPERLLMSRVTSRLGLTRLTFQAYTHKQLQEIVVNRLTGNNSFKSDAIQFVARKVASVSGDARRALDICRRSAEIAELEGPNTQVSMKHVNAALDAMITQPKVKAIAHCSKLEKLVLQSVIAEVERTGIEETVFSDVYIMLTSLAALEGFKMVSASLMASAVYRLSSCRLLLADQKCVDVSQRIILNVSSDDVYYALKKD